ncbi:energy-coupling factor transporter transmembrane protein EcfT [Bifidobacterium sp. 64T4]|uniref:energy-coupling factor transporter transmembrane component T n=1 Tax=Bifidobacterium pongonis TaxID=2834432 RepID=UPI001C57F69F|nr:energy-coupling factor transporter transmembrane component T [Bifidobacterium pongonis]MBW3094527.1 energy-coupling factor transporter transmembrane protein EcfT [Bifidobacterium pongonis]
MVLDPRAKLYLLLLANLLLFFHASVTAEVLLVAMLLMLLLAARKYASCVRLGAVYALLLAGTWVSTWDDGNVWLHALGLLCVGIRMMMPCLVAGAYAFTTTSSSEFVCAMRRMHVPESVVIPCVVCIRFFPTIHSDYRQIRNAMALRGIAQGRAALLRHPAQSLEYVLMPLLMNAANVAQDLSVAALTKGLGMPGEHTSRVLIRMRWFDWAWMLACTLPLALNMGGLL